MTITHGISTTEHNLFLKSVEGRGLFELAQHEFTHRSRTGISRIDRVYCNFGPAMQLDHQAHCEPLAASGIPFTDDRNLRHLLRKHRTLLHFESAKEADRQDGRPLTGLR